ncbi:M24 family metallopeptidase [uncultured Gimesia sp.]|uniref:M24 family metallopeptidase n=1 Tax=uncultured Gimesia sp. TaxID=1678688 RepID=UPI00261EE3D5|nr:M24 family metallopeptidase [uncultured Gimesia sp.]
MKHFREYQAVQQAAKQTLSELTDFISPSATEASIAAFAQTRLADLGCPETWYYACPAFVLLGSRSCLSISGSDYVPATESVGETNLITVDLSPCKNSLWGDCARSFVVEQGKVVSNPVNAEFRRGLEVQQRLHSRFLSFVTPDTTFGELFRFVNDLITAEGFECLDFLSNVGHSIASDLKGRLFIEADSQSRLGSVPCFTLEPHIREKGGSWGFKHENIYYFDERGQAVEL